MKLFWCSIVEHQEVGFNPDDEKLEGDGSEFYTLAPTPLSFRSDAPLNELQEIQINGVTVDPSNYTLEEGSTIVTFPIDYLKTLDIGSYEVSVVSESKTVNGDFTITAPELNEHGFYYNQPYVGVINGGQYWMFFFREDGTLNLNISDDYTEDAAYTCDDNNLTIIAQIGTFTGIASNGEVFCNEAQTTFNLSDDYTLVADDEYIYTYNEELGGYEVSAINKFKTSYKKIKTGIYGIPTVKITNNMFFDYIKEQGNQYITNFEIPNDVIYIGEWAFCNCESLTSIVMPNIRVVFSEAFRNCTSLISVDMPNVIDLGVNVFCDCINLKSITIPNTITDIPSGSFWDCVSLTSVVIPDSVTSIGQYVFEGCTSLTSITIPDSVTRIWDSIFEGCISLTSITYTGTIEQWNSISKITDWNYGSSITEIQCSDGTITL